jgi:Rod binding domain-containing protein
MNDLSGRLEVQQALSIPPGGQTKNSAQIRQASQQFEAILLTQILSMASENGGWLGSGDDSASGCATGLAEQQLGTMLAEKGGIGLAPLSAQGLEARK